MREVKKERSRWRDEDLSERHRLWGWDCPAIDVDCLWLEYDSGKPVALVEYKHEYAKNHSSKHPSHKAIIYLGNSAKILVLAVRYANDFSWWKLTPLNQIAFNVLKLKQTKMTEQEYVGFMYKIRNKKD